MENSEISFKNTLSILNEERNKALCLSGANMFKTMHLIDALIEQVVEVMEEPIDDIVLLGSKVELEIINNGVSYYDTFILSNEFDEDGELVAFYSPVGRKLLGKHLGEVVYFEVENTKNEAKIMSVTNVKEKQKLLTNN